jgi:hypothetical protein
MKKLMLMIMLLMSTMIFANEQAPAYLKDGVITVTLKNGKTYTFSANEYMVVKRGAKSSKNELAALPVKEVENNRKPAVDPVEKRLKHIVSGEVLRSNRGLDTSTSANQVDVKNRKQIGVGIQYQYNVYKDLFLGGRVDTNGGAGVNLGVGF